MTDYNRSLRLDRRLVGRRGWIAPEELERELAALPDVSDKILPPEEDSSAPPGDGAPDPAAG